tara:strand:- start:454 stop:636 length:183 start_codon:yes stop_codon:yes gene_type:complete
MDIIEEEKKTCTNCGAEYNNIKHDLPEEDYKERFCPFCGHESDEEDENFEGVENRYEDWN